MRRAVEIFRASLGDEHPSTATVVENYRLLREASGVGGGMRGQTPSVF